MNTLALKIGIVAAVATIFFGFAFGGAMGVAEDAMKAALEARGRSVFEAVYGGDEGKLDKVLQKSWQYCKRSHLHAGAIGTAALACGVAVWVMLPGRKIASWSVFGVGVGGFFYSLYWLWAAYLAPALGSTGAAKEALALLAIPSAGLCLLGIAGVGLELINEFFRGKK